MGSKTRFLFLEKKQWRIALLVGAVTAVCLLPWYYFISFWIGVSLFMAGVTAVHWAFASRFIVGFPHIAFLIAALQYVFAAWVSFYFPPENPTFEVGGALPFYLSFAGPVVAALFLAWGASLRRLQPARSLEVGKPSPAVGELDALLIVGVTAAFLGGFARETSFAFVLVLVSNLRYVGVFGHMLSRSAGWSWRLAIVLAIEVMFATESAMFHTLLLTLAWTFAMWLYCFTPSYRVVLVVLLLGLITLPALQEAKWRARGGLLEVNSEVIDESELVSEAAFDKAVQWLAYVQEGVVHTVTLSLSDEFIAEAITRYNQGWIINRLLYFVPSEEPYAKGETLKTAAVSALVPRVLMADKFEAGGRKYMARFARMDLGEATAMDMGFAGEMYVNFGFIGGVAGCAAYALFFGIIFRVVTIQAFKRPMWWAIVPYIFFAALKAEDGVGVVLNWTVKSCVVIFAVCIVMPRFRRALIGENPQPAFRPGSGAPVTSQVSGGPP